MGMGMCVNVAVRKWEKKGKHTREEENHRTTRNRRKKSGVMEEKKKTPMEGREGKGKSNKKER